MLTQLGPRDRLLAATVDTHRVLTGPHLARLAFGVSALTQFPALRLTLFRRWWVLVLFYLVVLLVVSAARPGRLLGR